MSRPTLSRVSSSSSCCVASSKTLNISGPLCARLLMGIGFTKRVGGTIPEQARCHKSMKMSWEQENMAGKRT